jgi:hypothetical protein
MLMLNRRHFLTSTAAIGGAAVLSRVTSPVWAAEAPTLLQAGTRTIEVRGKAAKVFGIH